jgi:hypothetical protein
MGDMRNAYKIFIMKPDGRDHFEDTGMDERIILKVDLKETGQFMGWIYLAWNVD